MLHNISLLQCNILYTISVNLCYILFHFLICTKLTYKYLLMLHFKDNKVKRIQHLLLSIALQIWPQKFRRKMLTAAILYIAAVVYIAIQSCSFVTLKISSFSILKALPSWSTRARIVKSTKLNGTFEYCMYRSHHWNNNMRIVICIYIWLLFKIYHSCYT